LHRWAKKNKLNLMQMFETLTGQFILKIICVAFKFMLSNKIRSKLNITYNKFFWKISFHFQTSIFPSNQKATWLQETAQAIMNLVLWKRSVLKNSFSKSSNKNIKLLAVWMVQSLHLKISNWNNNKWKITFGMRKK
jgi:hypothetical protein